jgi:diketogulonate reductase-like aldo/keto reductase
MMMKGSTLFVMLNSLLLCPLCKGGLFGGFKKEKGGLVDDVPTAPLSNDKLIPLIGLGVGNLLAAKVENMIYEGLKGGNRIRLIDTAHVSHNEELVAKGITSGVKNLKDSEKIEGPVQVHVVTKIWYTHLGYERTKLSIRESLGALDEAVKDPDVDLKVHFLIHWPQCYSGVEWMNCEQEENDLPEEIKQAGPAPHLNKENAWKESWKALEDMYTSGDYPALASIGVSNFKGEDMDSLMKVARVKPHLIQINVWSLLNDPRLVDLCNRSKIHIQVFDVMKGVLGRASDAPHANHHLLMVADHIEKEFPEDHAPVTTAQVVLKWLVQYGISVIPRTSNLDRLQQNSAVSLSTIPDLSEERLEIVGHAVESMLSGNDEEDDVHVTVTFHAKNQDMVLFYYPGPTAEDELMIAYIKQGDSFQDSTHPRHSFRLYSADDPHVYHDHTVQGAYGEHHHVHVDL